MASARARIAIVLGFSLALAGETAVLIRQSVWLAAARRENAAEARSVAQLRDALHQSRETASRGPAPPPGTAPSRERIPAVPDDRAALARRDAALDELNRELSDARAETAQVRRQLDSAQRDHEQDLSAAGDRYRGAQQQWQGRLDDLQAQLDSARAQAQAARQRVTELKAVNARLQAENSDRSARTAAIGRATAGLQDLDRRRDTCLTSLVRRYRDVAGQLRAMNGMMEASRGASSELAGPALARIESTISLAEDDLRQLNDLTARYRQLETRLARN